MEITEKDKELLREIKVLNGKNEEIEYESLDGYEVPPRTQFSMLKKAAVSFKYKEMTFNMASLRLFDGIKYVLTPANSTKKRLALIPCKEEEAASVEWARLKGEKWVNKKITSLDFIENIYAFMGWDRNCRYKVLGHFAKSDRGLILVFDLTEAIMFSPLPEEYTDKRTGQVKRRRLVYYPDEYKGRIGKSYNDYYAAQQTSIFENLDEYQNLGKG